MVLRIAIQHGGRVLFHVADISSQVGIVQVPIGGVALHIPEITRLIDMLLLLIHVHGVFVLLHVDVEEARRLDPLAHLTAVYLLVRETRTFLIIPCCYESARHR